MDYFYCPPEKISNNSLLIDGDEFAHLVHVMRKKEGDEIGVVDGRGTAYRVRLGVLKKHMVHADILGTMPHHNEPSVDVTLAVGVLKNPSKFDFLIEKATEIGVKHFVPLLTHRTIPSHAKVDRWQKLTLAAMKQCGRSYWPTVSKLMTLDELLTQRDQFDLNCVAHENPSGSTHIRKLITKKYGSILILLGPEGGFDDAEVQRCIESGFTHIYLGERRLRTETAAVVTAGFCLLSEGA